MDLTALPEFCPQCLTPLPSGYPFDHVAIDRALTGDSSVLRQMREVELAEAFRVGRARGMSEKTAKQVLQLTTSQFQRFARAWYRNRQRVEAVA